MSFVKLHSDLFETFTIELSPFRMFITGSATGVTGSAYVNARRTAYRKDAYLTSLTLSASFNEHSSLISLDAAHNATLSGTTNILPHMTAYMTGVNAQVQSSQNQAFVDVKRSRPGVFMTSSMMQKLTIINTLYPYHRPMSDKMNFAFTNYQCVNFFTASTVPESTALLYPAPTTSASYAVTGAFTFCFYINPRRHFINDGTILYMSSCYAISLVTGSYRDENGNVRGYRVKLQLSHSANIPPPRALTGGTYPSDLVFMSDDNSLIRNKWHHVAIRWGTNTLNAGTGTFHIDSEERGRFVIPSASLALSQSSGVLSIGSYIAGNAAVETGSHAKFFNATVAVRNGVMQMTSSLSDPVGMTFRDPLNAELHDLRIYERHISDKELMTSSFFGMVTGTFDAEKASASSLFYLPVLFIKETPTRVVTASAGGVIVTPLSASNATTDDPTNHRLSLGVNGHDVNVENFVYDFIGKRHPRLFHLTSSIATGVPAAIDVNDALYSTASYRKRSITIMPCDNGRFTPDYRMLLSGALKMVPDSGSAMGQYVDDLGVIDMSAVSLRDQVRDRYVTYDGIIDETGSLAVAVMGPSPKNMSASAGVVPTAYQLTGDRSSNDIVMFDISNIFYGKSIRQGSIELIDSSMTGSAGAVTIRLLDDGAGSLYRADSDTPHAKWASVGNVFYDEGVIVLKAPTLAHFGKDGYTLKFRGIQPMHVMKMSIIADVAHHTTSSNPTFRFISSSLASNIADDNAVMITGMNVHDRDMNIIARAQFAQPIIKRSSDRLMVKARLDF